MENTTAEQKADTARAAFDHWISGQLATDPTATPRTLVNGCMRALGRDSEFVYGWVYSTLRDHVAAHLSRQGGAYDLPVPTVGSVGSAAPHASTGGRRPGTTLPKPKTGTPWGRKLDAKTVPVRTKLLRRTDLVQIVADERLEATRHETFARFAETLLTRMPNGNPQVGDVWTDRELKDLFRSTVDPTPILPDPTATENA